MSHKYKNIKGQKGRPRTGEGERDHWTYRTYILYSTDRLRLSIEYTVERKKDEQPEKT